MFLLQKTSLTVVQYIEMRCFVDTLGKETRCELHSDGGYVSGQPVIVI